MTYSATVVKIMIASPSDVAEERQAVREVIHEWNSVHSEDRRQVLMPVGWETHTTPIMGDRPQSIINKQILKDCDILVAIFWARFGSPTGLAQSGTAEEIQEHINSGKPAMIYFSSVPVVLDSVDPLQYAALKEFKGKCYVNGLVENYESIDGFRELFARQLAQRVILNFPTSQASTNLPPMPASSKVLTDDAMELLRVAAKSKRGLIMRARFSRGLEFTVDSRSFCVPGDTRSEARWEGALDELETAGFVEAMTSKREGFKVTNSGFLFVDANPEASN